MISATILGRIESTPQQSGDNIEFTVSIQSGFGKDAPEVSVPVRKYGQLGSWKFAQWIKQGKIFVIIGEVVISQDGRNGVKVSHIDARDVKFVPFEKKDGDNNRRSDSPAPRTQSTSGNTGNSSSPSGPTVKNPAAVPSESPF